MYDFNKRKKDTYFKHPTTTLYSAPLESMSSLAVDNGKEIPFYDKEKK